MHPLARPCAQRLTLLPGLKLWCLVEDPALAEALRSLVQSAGAECVAGEEVPGAATLDLAEPPGVEVPARARRLVEDLPAGARLVVCFHAGLAALPREKLATELGPRFRLAGAECWRAEDGSGVLTGVRRPPLPASERKRLRGLGHGLEPTLQVGKQGLAPGVVEALRGALWRHGLVKLKLAVEAPAEREDTAAALAWAVGAELVQRVGRVALYYRPDVPLEPPVTRKRSPDHPGRA